MVAWSSAETKYRAMAAATCELIWIKQLLRELKFGEVDQMELCEIIKRPFILHQNPVFHGRTERIEIVCHFVREKILSRDIITKFVKSSD